MLCSNLVSRYLTPYRCKAFVSPNAPLAVASGLLIPKLPGTSHRLAGTGFHNDKICHLRDLGIDGSKGSWDTQAKAENTAWKRNKRLVKARQ